MEYKPNSHAYKAKQEAEKAEKKIEQVASGSVKPRKKNGISKLADVFIAEDVSNVKQYLVQDVLIPTIKKTILNTVDIFLYGSAGSRDRHTTSSKVSYRKYYDDPRDDRRRDTPSVRPRFDYDDITYKTRGEAEVVLDQMRDVIDTYGMVTVADMYDMARLDQPYTSNKYGWTSLTHAEIVRLRDGDYIIKLPKAMALD